MTIRKQNQINQFLAVCVDKTDFATIESGVTSNFTVTLFTVKQGVSTAASTVTISRVPSVIRSGVIRVTLEAADTSGVDNAILNIKHASCADQNIPIDFEVQDISNYLSQISTLLSDVDSQVLLNASMISDVQSALDSQFLIYQSDISQVDSAVDAAASQLLLVKSSLSDVESQVDLNASLASDAHSAAAQGNSRTLVIQSRLSDVESQVDLIPVVDNSGAISDLYSLLSDLNSNILSRIPKEMASKSLLSDVNSDLASQIAGITATVGASDISDIASAVKVIQASRLSDILSATQQGNSRTLVLQSRISDVESAIDAGVPIGASDMSDIRSAINAMTATVSASDISDIASAVKVIQASRLSDILSVAQQSNSRVLVVRSMVSDVDSQVNLIPTNDNSAINSDIYSLLSDLNSNILSRVPKEVASKSLLSDVNSDLASQIAGITASVGASDISDIASAVKVILASTLSDIDSRVDDVHSLLTAHNATLSDFKSDFQSRVPKEVASKSLLSDVNSDLASQIAGITVTVSVSDISDIASAVKIAQASRLSDILSAAAQGNSRALILQSKISDIESQVDLNASVISDVQSQVDLIPTDNNSAIASDIYSLLSDLNSNILSRVPKEVSSKSLLSDINSDLASQIAGITATVGASDISDIASAVKIAVWSDFESKVGRTTSDMYSALMGAAGITASDVASKVWTHSAASDLISKIGAIGGVGAISWTYTLTDSVSGGPIDGAEVWVTSDSAGSNVIASGTTDTSGEVTFMLDAGTVYIWAKKAGYNIDASPDEETVS